MSDLNITKGKAFVSLEDTFGSQPRVETDEKLICCVGNGEDYLLTLDEWTENADLIAEAFNVANETGKTPRQLLEQRNDLLAACKAIMNAETQKQHELAVREVEKAIAKAEGRS
ncbi:hypothetical protein [Thalassospira aquimaris]|uniref:Uncharacterized protein n=1 Tax=Thalassospira aquimaris TaxID=3037796 RepID=A0ABT6GIG3_9PROT|nr:hypothetical protein [Thalassospira sp. FZY0004]MDG4721855.1 hypothetical protein [Thalassospira sp. FZY0004]